MPKIVVDASVFVEGDLNKVYNYVTDPMNYPLWRTGMSNVVWQEESVKGRPGSRYEFDYTWEEKTHRLVHEVILDDPPSKQGFKAVLGPYPIDGTVFFKEEEGKIRINMHQEIRSDSILTAIMFGLFGSLLTTPTRNHLQTDLDKLAEVLTSSYSDKFL